MSSSKFHRIEALKNQTILQKEKLLQALDLKYSFHFCHLLQQRYLIAEHIQKRYDLLINYMNDLHINDIHNDNANDALFHRILGLIKSLKTDQPLPENNLNQDIPIQNDPPQNEPYQPKCEINTDRVTPRETAHYRARVEQYQIRYPEILSPPKHCYRNNTNADKTTKSKSKRKKKPKLSEKEIKEWDNTKLSSLLAKDIRRLLLTRGAKKNQLVVKKSQLLELLKENYPVSLPMPYSELTRADLHSELRLRGLESKLKGKDKGKESLIKILNGETVTKTKKYASNNYKPYIPQNRLDTICAGCLVQCNSIYSKPTIECSRCFRDYHRACIPKGKVCKLCLDKNADRRSKRLENKSTNYTDIPTPTSLIGINLAHDEEYSPPSPPTPEQISGHKRLVQEMNMIPSEQYHQYHEVPSYKIKRRRLNTNKSIPPQLRSQLRSIPALTKNDGTDDSKRADVEYDNPDLSWNLRKEGILRGAIHNLTYGTQTFSQLPIKCKSIIGIALMNEIVRGSGRDNELKKFPMWYRPTVRDVLRTVGGGKPAQYACSGVILDGRVINVSNAGDHDEQKLFGYLADEEVIELVKQNIINQQDTRKKTHCQQVIKCFEDAMKARIPTTKKQLDALKESCRTYVLEMNRPQQQEQMDCGIGMQRPQIYDPIGSPGGHQSDGNISENKV
eukprot:795677_1